MKLKEVAVAIQSMDGHDMYAECVYTVMLPVLYPVLRLQWLSVAAL